MGAGGGPRQAALRESPAFTAYVPRLLPAWAAAVHGPAHRVVDGSLLLFDITGFTPMRCFAMCRRPRLPMKFRSSTQTSM